MKIKKKTKKLCLLLLMLLCLCPLGCKREEPSFKLKARVLALGDKLEVDVIEGEYASGLYWVITSEKTKIMGSDGRTLALSDISVGDTLEIVYNGQVMMSYPAQIVARKITVL